MEYHPHQLLCAGEAQKVSEGIALGGPAGFSRASSGGLWALPHTPCRRYFVTVEGRLTDDADDATRLLFEVTGDCGGMRYAAVERAGGELANFAVHMEFIT